MLELLVQMVDIKNLSIRYRSTGQLVIDNLDLHIEKGEVVAVLGRSGCGKTTLLSAIAGLLGKEAICEGQISLENEGVATVFQEPRLLPWRTVLRNVTFGLEAKGINFDDAKTEAQKVLELVGLHECQNLYPGQLSLGMRQRVNFARALACKPGLLLLDEPFSALDKDTKEQIIFEFSAIVHRLSLTTIFVTHDNSEAKALADRILTFRRGFVGVSRYRKSEEDRKNIFNSEIEAVG